MTHRVISIAVFSSALGPMAVAADSSGVVHRIWFDFGSKAELLAEIKSTLDQMPFGETPYVFHDAAHPALVRRLRQFVKGRVDTFADIQIEQGWMTPFQRQVVRAARRIPYGQTKSYGDLAATTGHPRAARAVGSVMAKNRFPLLVPCHRVIGSAGKLGGFSSRRGLSTKTRLLTLEAAGKKNGALAN